MSGWLILFIFIWLTGAFGVEALLRWKPPGSEKIESFQVLWIVGSLAGLALIMTGVLGYMIDGLTISAGCFGVMLRDHLNQRKTPTPYEGDQKRL